MFATVNGWGPNPMYRGLGVYRGLRVYASGFPGLLSWRCESLEPACPSRATCPKVPRTQIIGFQGSGFRDYRV